MSNRWNTPLVVSLLTWVPIQMTSETLRNGARTYLLFLAARDFGVDSADVTDTRKVIELANRYAEAGAPLLLDRLEQQTDLALPRLYLVAELFSDLVSSAVSDREGKTF